MPIEFACPGCNKHLRVADSAAGKRARCPDCGAVSNVPTASPASDFSGFSAPQPASDSEAQWSTGNWTSEPPPAKAATGSPFATNEAAENPFSAPASNFDSARAMSLQEVRTKVAAPAICMMVAGIITAAFASIYLVLMLIGIVATIAQNDPGETLEAFAGFGMFLIPLVRAGLIIYGAVQMKKLKNYPFAMTAAILSVIPFCSCVFIDLPFGIWALVVLSNTQVKQAFDAAKY